MYGSPFHISTFVCYPEQLSSGEKIKDRMVVVLNCDDSGVCYVLGGGCDSPSWSSLALLG